jgi:predicted nucleotidyltransferase
MKQKAFIDAVVEKIKDDPHVTGLAVAGSFITQEIDEFSDVDLILVTRNKIAPDLKKMEAYAQTFGDYLNGFTGEHVGERRVLICLYDNPLLHVDIKFLTLDEFEHRVEDPVIVFDRHQALENVIQSTKSAWPTVDYQWIEDRFWTWVHYTTLKLGRGEDFEALDTLSFIRTLVTAPLLQIKNGQLPRGTRKVEFNFEASDLKLLIATAPAYSAKAIFEALENTVSLYQKVRKSVYPQTVQLKTKTEARALDYLAEVKMVRLGYR